jgi:hypothetical protein
VLAAKEWKKNLIQREMDRLGYGRMGMAWDGRHWRLSLNVECRVEFMQVKGRKSELKLKDATLSAFTETRNVKEKRWQKYCFFTETINPQPSVKGPNP